MNGLNISNTLLALEPCHVFNIQYYCKDFYNVGDIQYYSVRFRKLLFLMKRNVCKKYIWCKHTDIQVVIMSMTSKRGRQSDSTSSCGGNVRNVNKFGASLENILDCWNVVVCKPLCLLKGESVQTYPPELITSGIMLKLSSCSSLENSAAAAGVNIDLEKLFSEMITLGIMLRSSSCSSLENSAAAAGVDIDLGEIFSVNGTNASDGSFFSAAEGKTKLFIGYLKWKHFLGGLLLNRVIPQTQTDVAVTGLGRMKLLTGGTSETRGRLLLLNRETRCGVTSFLTEMSTSSMICGRVTWWGSICKIFQLKLTPPSIHLKGIKYRRVKLSGICVEFKTNLFDCSLAMEIPALLRSEVTNANLDVVHVMKTTGRLHAVHGNLVVILKRLAGNPLGDFEGVIEHKWGGLRHNFLVYTAVRKFGLSINVCCRNDASPNVPTAVPTTLTTRHADAGAFQFRGPVTLITTTITVAEAANRYELDQGSAVQNSRQNFSKLLAKRYATFRKKENKDVRILIFIDNGDQEAPIDTIYELDIAVIDTDNTMNVAVIN